MNIKKVILVIISIVLTVFLFLETSNAYKKQKNISLMSDIAFVVTDICLSENEFIPRNFVYYKEGIQEKFPSIKWSEGKPLDTWGNAISMHFVEDKGLTKLILRSNGRDGRFGTDDDLMYHCHI